MQITKNDGSGLALITQNNENTHVRDKPDALQRSETWKQIWEKKYKEAQDPIHKVDGFDLLTGHEWSKLVAAFCQLMGPLDGKDVLEVGCGAGAFLGNITGARSLAGIDYSNSAIEIIKSRLVGQFLCAGANSIPFQDKSFDVVFSFGVFFYFDSPAYAKTVVREMFRIARAGARIFVLDVNDEMKIEKYHQLRALEKTRDFVKRTNGPTTHLFFTKRLFQDLAADFNARVIILDESELNVSFHTGSDYRFAVRFDVPG